MTPRQRSGGRVEHPRRDVGVLLGVAGGDPDGRKLASQPGRGRIGSGFRVSASTRRFGCQRPTAILSTSSSPIASMWLDGPPHELFSALRSECPVHWTSSDHRVPGRGRLLVGDPRGRRPRGQPRLARRTPPSSAASPRSPTGFPLELMQAMFIGMDPPKHDRLKALFQRGFTPNRIADHEHAIRAIIGRRARPARRPRHVRPRDRRRAAGRLARDRQLHGHPARGRRRWATLMNSTLGAGDPDLNPDGHRGRRREATSPRSSRAASGSSPSAASTRPTTSRACSCMPRSTGEKLEEHEIVMGFFLLVAAGNDSTKATYCSGDARADGEPRPAPAAARRPVARCPSAVEEALRMFPAFAHFRRTATRDTELAGQQIRRATRS